MPVNKIVMTGTAGAYGASLLFALKEGEIRERFLPEFVKGLEDASQIQVETIDDFLSEQESFTVPIGKRGVLGAFFEMGKKLKVGFDIFQEAIPLSQEVIEMCEKYDINPYRLEDQGNYLIVTSSSEDLCARFQEAGIQATVVGVQRPDKEKRIIIDAEEVTYLQRQQELELEKL